MIRSSLGVLPLRHLLIAVLIASFGVAVGCQEPSMRSVAKRAENEKNYKNRKILTPENSKYHRPPRREPAEADASTLASLDRSYEATRQVQSRTGNSESVAVQNATRAIQAGLEAGPTLAIWLFDRTQSAQTLVQSAVATADRFYASSDVQQLTQSPE
jgi:hypothetical protein